MIRQQDYPYFYQHDVSEWEVEDILGDRYKTFLDGMIIELQSARLKRDDI
ncbi:MAG TPA: hypothetical protein VGK99_04945 [Acidobacteriota bacterium]